MLKNVFWQYLAENWRWGHEIFRIRFSNDAKQDRAVKFKIGICGYLTIVSLLFPLGRSCKT